MCISHIVVIVITPESINKIKALLEIFFDLMELALQLVSGLARRLERNHLHKYLRLDPPQHNVLQKPSWCVKNLELLNHSGYECPSASVFFILVPEDTATQPRVGLGVSVSASRLRDREF